ncbi:DUF4325 domain-containing protein [Ferruginibacter paludis]|uniref:STAS-like domain-containing protein n=1 Tax=Ferruginibacter paludis TaxID=1310417 RepID=UPI0025B2F894|nr:DUF4325 domain-containing protein [Ferruginibacter paludis]MDN3657964.1 DUF4325 domain-containing protein [Ferruginibacter paludis]
MTQTLNILSVINKKSADSMEDAALVLPIVENAIATQTNIDLSFEGMDICSTIFLNNFLGKLYLHFGAKVDEYVKFVGFDDENEAIPNKIQRLKRRALNPDAFHEIYNNAIGKA